jgi:hypothetical protein
VPGENSRDRGRSAAHPACRSALLSFFIFCWPLWICSRHSIAFLLSSPSHISCAACSLSSSYFKLLYLIVARSPPDFRESVLQDQF